MLPKLDIYKGRPSMKMRLYGAPVWEVQGIDISKWNGTMNFAITKTKCQYVIIRYGYGNGWKDPSADTFYREARAQDMPVGAYWFYNIGEDPIAHVDGFVEELATKPVQLDMWQDAERTSVGPTQTLEWLKTADGRLRNKTGKIPGVYTSMGFWNTGVARSSYWIGRQLWDATWTTRDYPTIPLDWGVGWEDWQWQADGNHKAAEYGSTGGDPDMDLDRWNGNVTQFNLKHGTHIQPLGGIIQPPPPPPGTLPPYVIINTGALAIHSTPLPIDANKIGSCLQGSKWYPLDMINGGGVDWYKIAKDAYISKNYVRYP
jgi:GH25 family lysozyme M1 (1,4-beta-N-acetylmuramidase)